MQKINSILLILVFFSLINQVSAQDLPLCEDGATRPCGSNIGACEPGTRVCIEGNWSDCSGGKGPKLEICGNGLDENCNSLTDECPLSAGMVLILIGNIVIGFAGVLVILSVD